MIHHARTAMKKEKGDPATRLPHWPHRIHRHGDDAGRLIANPRSTSKRSASRWRRSSVFTARADAPLWAGRTFESWFKKHTPFPVRDARQVIFFTVVLASIFEVETLHPLGPSP